MKNTAANVLKDLTLMQLLLLLLETLLKCRLVIFLDDPLNFRSGQFSLPLYSDYCWGFPFYPVRILLFILTLLNKLPSEGPELEGCSSPTGNKNQLH